MSYTVDDRLNVETGNTEYIVIDGSGVIAHPPHGGPFSSMQVAYEHLAMLLMELSIEEWIAAHAEYKRIQQLEDYPLEGSGKVLYIAPDGRWIQNKGRGYIAVQPPTDFELEIGQSVNVGKSGEIEPPEPDNEPTPSF